jgi:methionyl-tRNA synthetase
VNHLITSALPYINGTKHLGNLAGSLLPADIHARFLRQSGEDVAFICATDEHGTPAELGAAAEGLAVREYCDRQHRLQADLYGRLDLSFDHFGRTSSATNRRLTQEVFLALDAAGFIEEREVDQVWSPADGRFLPDRYVEGTCPHCGGEARGDQCDACSTTLDPTELLDARSAISGATGLEVRASRHLFLRQSALATEIGEWLDSRRGWPPQVLGIARGWLAQDLTDRCITRDLEWGVPVPRPGFEGKVFYVWFDAPIGYIAATTEWCSSTGRDVDRWWSSDASVRHVQFLAKDNVPFHAITFPASIIGSRLPLHTADVVKGVNWLLHEGGKFSTSRRRGVFLDQALGIAGVDQWRWWLAANCPESADTDFTFRRFADGVNADLADKLGNLVSRVLGLVAGKCGGVVPHGEPGPAEFALRSSLGACLEALEASHRAIDVRRSADVVRGIWDLANGYVAAQAPWTLLRTDPDRAATVLREAVGLIRVSAVAVHPFAPRLCASILALIGEDGVPAWTTDPAAALAVRDGVRVDRPAPLVPKLDDAWVAEQTARFSGGD